MKRVLYVIDIDGTCADFTVRNRAAGPEPSRADRAAYLAWLERLQDEHRLANDPVVPGMPDMVRALAMSNRLYFVTGREERYREVTRRWLETNGFPSRPLLMRQKNDWRSASAFKLQTVSELQRPGEAVIVLDDCPEPDLKKICIEMGWTLLKACSGGTL